MWGDTQADSERESHPRNNLIMGFLWPVILIHLALGPYLIYLRIILCVHTSLSQNRFQQRGLWVDLTSLPFWPRRSFLVRKISLTLRMRNMWSLIFYQCGAQPPLLIVLLLIFWSFFPQRMKSNYSLLEGPSTSGLKMRLDSYEWS